MDLLKSTYYGNTLLTWILAFSVMVFMFIVLRLAKRPVLKRLTRLTDQTKTQWYDLLVYLLQKTRVFLLAVVAFYAGLLVLDLPSKIENLTVKVLIMAFLAQGAIWADALVVYLIKLLVEKKTEEDVSSVAMITMFGFVSRVAVWSIVILLALDNIGINVTALVAGLGIGGVAIALASQNVLGDLFASISIVLDKPFVIGDFIIVGDMLGSVEHIGIKTTRVRSLFGEQLVFSNNDLLNSRIRNYKRMDERRVVFSIGVVYQTPYEKLSAIPGMVRKIVEEQEQTRFDRAHFSKYGDFALIYEIVYYVKIPDYNAYMDIQEAINLEIYRTFHEEGIDRNLRCHGTAAALNTW
jgi:small-conductance mechanosensitive channel